MRFVSLIHGDCLDVMPTMDAASVDAVVTDPPYGLGFMGKAWDSTFASADVPMRRRREMDSVNAGASRQGGRQRACADYQRRQAVDSRQFGDWCETWASACLRVAKPGAHLLAFGGTRTFHRLACAIEDAGWEIRDTIMWVYGSGFPKSHNGPWGGTALKPAWEPIIVARKSLDGTVEQNHAKHGTGALNIDGCRVELHGDYKCGANGRPSQTGLGDNYKPESANQHSEEGRWPANLIHDGSEEVVSLFPWQSGGGQPKRRFSDKTRNTFGKFEGDTCPPGIGPSSGNAARFFYCAKASRSDRNDGLGDMPEKPLNWSSGTQNPGSFQSEGTKKAAQNNHPTVKPTDLMRYLCRLVTPPGGVVLDPFCGSGSTGKAAMLEGFHFIGIEREEAYCEIAAKRIQAAEREASERLVPA